MSVARFFILVGPGHRYHGDGMQPQVLLTMYDGKSFDDRFRSRSKVKTGCQQGGRHWPRVKKSMTECYTNSVQSERILVRKG